MGTRGAYGFRIDGEDKVTYNHFDSYPSGLGRDLLKELRGCDRQRLFEVARKLVLVDGKSKPTPEQIEQLRKYANTDVSTRSLDEWYVLLRETQGTILPWLNGEVPVMIDNHSFLRDSLFCEWAYIVNLDERILEIYRGFNKSQTGSGRYAALHTEGDGDYFGVTLLTTMPLDEIANQSDAELDQTIERWEEMRYPAEDPTLAS